MPPPSLSSDAPCRIAVVTVDEGHAETIAGRLKGAVVNRGHGFAAHVGGLFGQRIIVAAARPAPGSLAAMIEAIVAAHGPQLVVAGGPCSGLAAPAERGRLVVADEIVNEAGKRLKADPAVWRPADAVIGPIVSLDLKLLSALEKESLAKKYGAVALDQQAFAVAQACSAEQVPFLAVGMVTDGPADELPREIRFLLQRKSKAGTAGAFAGVLWRHPAYLKHLWQQKERALDAEEKLADRIVQLVQDLPPASE